MKKKITIIYDPNSSENLKPDALIGKEVDLIISKINNFENTEVKVAQWNYINEFIFKYVNGEITKEQLDFKYEGVIVDYDDLGFFVNEPVDFKSPSVGLVQRLTSIRMTKL